MKNLRVENGIIVDDIGVPVGTLIDTDSDVSKSISFGSEAVCALKEYVENIEGGGTPKPRTTYNKFKMILEKYEG